MAMGTEQLDLEQQGRKLADELLECADGLFPIGVHLYSLACQVRVAIGDRGRLEALLKRFEPYANSTRRLLNVLWKLHIYVELLPRVEDDGEEKDAT
jgi:hypothetical protein